MTEVEQAEVTIKSLEDKRQHQIQKATELADERQRVSFAAHTGDAKARQRLDKLNVESATHGSEMSSIESAIAEANVRLANARQAEAVAADRTAALALRDKLSKFRELGEELDDAVSFIAPTLKEMINILHEIHVLGCASPTSTQFQVLGVIALQSMIQEMPTLWVNAFEFQRLGPLQKKTFKSIVAGWNAQIEANIEQRLQSNKEAA
jgi:hypothetical protein